MITREDTRARDGYAADRTLLANERTFLAYIRTAIAIFLGGQASIHFFQNSLSYVLGTILVVTGILTLVYGSLKYFKTKERIRLQKAQDKKIIMPASYSHAPASTSLFSNFLN